ncbi:MAG: hypothetical protein MJK12_16005 [Colwellia sp.]|nr:hypothetical protein [Colwellia sp.]
MELVLFIVIPGILWFIFYILTSDNQGTAAKKTSLECLMEELEVALEKVKQLIESEDYEDAEQLCGVICEGVHDWRIYHALFIIHGSTLRLVAARDSIFKCLNLMNVNSEHYCAMLVEAMDTAVQCGDFTMAINCCERFKEKDNGESEKLTQLVGATLEDCLERKEKVEKTLQRFNNNSIDINETLDLLLLDEAFIEVFPLLKCTDCLSELAQLEYIFRAYKGMGDGQVYECAFELYQADVQSHSVYQFLFLFSFGERNEKLKREVLLKYRKDFGKSIEYKEFNRLHV